MTARLTADFWVRAYLARLSLAAIPAHLAAKGDPTAGAVAIKVATMDGRARVYERSFDLMSGERRWVVAHDGDEAESEALLARQLARDPDLWIVEVEDPKGRHLLDEDGLAN